MALALVLTPVYGQIDSASQQRGNIALGTLQTDFSNGTRYLRLQQEAIQQEVNMAEIVTPLIISALASLDSFLQS